MRSALIGLLVAFRLRPYLELGRRLTKRGPRSHKTLGFTLLETLTALTILSIALVSLLQAQATGLRAASSAELYAQARILGQSLLAQSVSGAGDRPRPMQGRHGPFKWSIKVSRAGQPVTSKDPEAVWRLHHVRVTIAWDRSRSIELDTLKLARAPDKGN